MPAAADHFFWKQIQKFVSKLPVNTKGDYFRQRACWEVLEGNENHRRGEAGKKDQEMEEPWGA